eukprot:129648_1
MSSILNDLDALIASFDRKTAKPNILPPSDDSMLLGAYEFVEVEEKDQKDVAMVLGVTDQTRMYHVRRLNGTCSFVNPGNCTRIDADNWHEILQSNINRKLSQSLPPMFTWCQAFDRTISLFFPSFDKDPKYEQSKYIYLKTIHLLRQSKKYITDLFIGVDEELNDIQYASIFHRVSVPSFKHLSGGFGVTHKIRNSYQIDLNANYIHDYEHQQYRPPFDEYASIFMGAITLYHEILHWFRRAGISISSISSRNEVVSATPEKYKYEGGYRAEIANTTGLWSCDWAVDDQIFDVFYWRVSQDCTNYADLKIREKYETGFVVGPPFIVAFVNDYKGDKVFWECLKDHLSVPDQYRTNLMIQARGQEKKGCLTHFYYSC